MTKKTVITSGKDLLSKNKPSAVGDGSHIDEQNQPTADDFAEVHSPDLSLDFFQIADKEFKIKISNIKTQKIMARSMKHLNDLLQMVDIRRIMKKFDEIKSNMRQENIKQLDKLRGLSEKELEAEFQKIAMSGEDPDSGFHIDFADMIKEIILSGGIDNILISITNLLCGCVYAICNSQDHSVTMDWIEENTNFKQIQNIFFRQMEKDEIQGKVIDFLAFAIHLLMGEKGSTQSLKK